MCVCGYSWSPRQFGWGSDLPLGSLFYLHNSLTFTLISVGCISYFHILSFVRPIFTTVHSYLPNSPSAWFVVGTVGAIKGDIVNISDDNRAGNNQGTVDFQLDFLDEVSKAAQQRPGPHLSASAAVQLLPSIPPRLQHHPPPYGLPQKPTVPQECMKDTPRNDGRRPLWPPIITPSSWCTGASEKTAVVVIASIILLNPL